MCWTYFKTIGHRPVTRGKGAKPPLQIFLPPLKKSVRHSWKLLDIVWKIWAPLRKLFATPGVPTWLRACGKPSDGLAFLTNNPNVTLILRWLYRRVAQKETQTGFYLLNCARRYFVKSKFGYWHPLSCSYESTYILLVDFNLFNRHNQWYSWVELSLFGES